MPPFHNPLVLMTRPKEASQRFLTELERVSGPFRSVINPAFEIVATDADIPSFEAAVFTSSAGVGVAPTGVGRTAYCVGDATSHAAQQAGYTVVNAQGSAADLCSLILAENPSETLLHIRGEISHGNVSATLNKAGLRCAEVIAYRKQSMPAKVDGIPLMDTGFPIIVPLFSAETVSILAQWQLDLSSGYVVAMSENVARTAADLSPRSIVLADHPDMASMVAATSRLIA